MADDVWSFAGLADAIRLRAARCGRVRLVAVDGPGGAGKSAFAARLAQALGGAPVISTDDFASWDTPTGWWPLLESGVLEPFAQGDPARYRPYDWVRRRRGRTRTVWPADVVLLEGVSCGRRSIAERVAYVIWIETPRATRLERGLERDGEAMRTQWDHWMAAEDLFYLNDPVRDRADLVVEGAPSILHDPETEFAVIASPDSGAADARHPPL